MFYSIIILIKSINIIQDDTKHLSISISNINLSCCIPIIFIIFNV